MQQLDKDVVRIVALVICMSIGSLAASAQTAPKPPVNLCIAGAVCVAAAAPPAVPPPPSAPPTAPASGGAKKWHPGYYLSTYRNNSTLRTQSARFADYDADGANPKLVGFYTPLAWADLESTQGNYAAGIAMLQAEIAHLQAEPVPKRFMFRIMDEPNGSYTQDSQSQYNWYPPYMQAACVTQEQIGGNGLVSHFTWWRSQCVDHFVALIKALGAALDGNPGLEVVFLNYEEALANGTVNSSDFSTGAFNAGVTRAVQAARAAFPHTLLGWGMNWGQNYTEAQVATLFTLMKANGVGVGDSDACPMRPDGTYTTDGSFPVYIDADNLIAGYGGYNTNHQPGVYTDQRGKMFIWGSVETSELGYNAVCGNPGMTGLPVAGYGALFNFWNDGIRASHVIVEKNTYIGTDAQRWKNAPGSLYDMVMNHPLTHTACPSDYDTQFGNGTAGSGCNTH